MDVRRVQKVSAGTFVISLPKKWAVKHDIGAGSILSLTENASGSLIVNTHAQRVAPKTPRLNDEDVLDESLIACYIMGAQSIIIGNATPSIRARTFTAIQELPGLDVAEETASTITVRCLLDESTVRFFSLLDRLCVLLKYGVELAASGTRQALLQNEQEINRAYHLCQRMLTKASHDATFLEQTGIPSVRVIPALQLLVKRLEHIGDALKELPEKVTPQAQKIMTTVIDMTSGMVRLLTAGKLATAKLPTKDDILELKKGQTIPQILFLIRTAEDVREEIILIRTGLTMFKDD